MKNLHILISLLLPATLLLLSCSVSLVLSFSLSQTHLQNRCLDDPRSALVQLQNGLYYAPNFTLSSKADLWDLNTDCCSWKGITCDAIGHVIGLDLSNKNLSGSFHSVFNLHHLQRLNLAGNNFNATLFQYEFDRLSNLTHLNLSSSCFHGQIPVEVSYLTRLVSLDLSNQDSCYLRYQQIVDPYYYSLPSEFYQSLKLENPNFKTLIKNLKSLTELYLDSANISTQSTKWCETTSRVLPNLRVLSLSNCDLKGPFCSSLSRLPFLSKLFLGGNSISYLPPNFLEISSRLVSLSLENCNLSGHFPTEILLLPKIQSIDISSNGNLMGQLPEFPLNNSLQILMISYTNFYGKLPESIGNLKFLTNLYLNYCNFSGQIPSSIANLTNLVELDLSYNNFSGLIPPFHRSGVPNLASLHLSYNQLSGPIHSSLFTLPSLQTLHLAGNQLVGEIGVFPNASSSLLKHLYLYMNHLSGSISKSFFQLSSLESLFIGYNNFDSPMIDMFCQLKNLRVLELSNMSSLLIGSDNKSLTFPQLERLRLRSCNLTEFPEFIKTQAKLVYLDLSFNAIDFSKVIPSSDANSSFPMLRYLYLQYCNTSTFPEFVMSQGNLEVLYLSNNKISGVVPNWVWKKSLRTLDLSNNSLSSLDQFSLNDSLTSSRGTLSRPICNLSQLQSFNASYNKLSGAIPSCLGNISTLEYLDLHKNNFSGSIPDFTKGTQLYLLQLSDNQLEGKLLRSLANCTWLGVLNLGNNTLYDLFPSWLGKLTELMVLVLRANRFYGPIKYVKNDFPALDVIDIASNDFSGQLPRKFFQASQLRSIMMGGNKLEGRLPRSLVSCSKLEVLDLGNNMLHDAFPFWLVKLPILKVLVLRSNRFYGAIQFSEKGISFPMLRILDLAYNDFSSELSGEFFQCLRAMMVMNDEDKVSRKYIGDNYYQDSVTIVNKGLVMVFEKILTTFTCLDLSNNRFHGIIPDKIGSLTSLRVLNLSQNSFSSQIPLALVNLKELESLDLSQNYLSGEIPPQLTTLTFLSVLDLSYNQLEGSIPQSNQFGTFLNDSYEGNRGLCGPPLTKRCNEADVPMAPLGEDADSWVDDISVWKIVLMGYASGLVIGFSIGFTVLNEMGNKWLDRYKRNRRRRSAEDIPPEASPDDVAVTRKCMFALTGLNLPASWQQILCFEGAIFEGMEVLVHKGTVETVYMIDSCQKWLTSKGILWFNLWSFCGVDNSPEASSDDTALVFLLHGINPLLTPLPNPKCEEIYLARTTLGIMLMTLGPNWWRLGSPILILERIIFQVVKLDADSWKGYTALHRSIEEEIQIHSVNVSSINLRASCKNLYLIVTLFYERKWMALSLSTYVEQLS
ncbi:hypothetical protein PTKIN_Ptkin09bG0236100 [Pterospermum kingtungense]